MLFSGGDRSRRNSISDFGFASFSGHRDPKSGEDLCRFPAQNNFGGGPRQSWVEDKTGLDLKRSFVPSGGGDQGIKELMVLNA